MSSYEYITRHTSPNFTPGRPRPPEEITIHHWGAEGQNLDSVVRWLCRPNGSSSSTYVAEAGRVACIVDPDDTPWTNSNFSSNQVSITIECRPEMTAGDFQTVVELVADILRAYPSIKRIRGHRDHASTACPGKWYGALFDIWDKAQRLNAATAAPVPQQTAPAAPAGKSIAQLADEVLAGLHGNGDARRRSLGDQYAAVQAEVNRRLAPHSAGKSIAQLADEVLAGLHGNGDARRRSLGDQYAAVQAEVNRRLS
ncbi:N-acetylmuramoyl-L-alanine amidase [Trueperella pyogenes]